MRPSDGWRCWVEDLWYGLHLRTGFEKNRRARWLYTIRSARCQLGLHWPIQWNTRYSSYEPPEPEWSCSFCGRERLPYRAVFWTGRLWTVRHPWQAWKYRAERPL